MTLQPPTPTPQPAGLAAHQFFFELQAAEPMSLHAHNGSSLRGMLYRAVAELATGDRRAPDLRFVPDPAIHRLLATLDENSPRGKDVPRPYVIIPPLPRTLGEGWGEAEHRLAPGETFQFGITLFGDAMEAFPILVMAMKHAERSGLGRHLPNPGSIQQEGGWARGRFRVVRAYAHNPLTRITQEFLAPGDRMVLTPSVSITHDDVMRQAELDAQASRGQLRIYFHTPMSLRQNKEPVPMPLFSVLLHRLMERLEALSAQYGGGLLPCLPAAREQRNALLRLADGVLLVRDDTRYLRVRGYSDRTRASTPLNGFVGVAEYAADDFSPFFALLRWGELTHAGQNTVKGNGIYRIQTA
ncbi:MAG TPA: CRISPR system precrRNA processing endoribonuclease RAMP protein Cas6 [Thermoflexales bacterium]|nr:CRISPR system precrRNA processing endoribonuclease RAMP protein Cas6 [Thermoflexales bacterium]